MTSDPNENTPGLPLLDGVAIAQLALVRVQSGLSGARADDQGRLVLSRMGSGREDEMNTFHFALNGTVTNHTFGKFDFPVALVSPLQATCHIEGQRPAGLDGADTYFHADGKREMVLAEATIVAPEGTALPAGFGGRVVFYVVDPDVAVMLERRNALVAEDLARRGMPVRDVAPFGWRGAQASSEEEYTQVSQSLGCSDLKRSLHMNAPDGALNTHFSLFAAAKHDFTAGERLHTAGDGSQKSLIEFCEEQVAGMRAALADLTAQTGCDRARSFYTAKIFKAEVSLERMRKVVEVEFARSEQLAAKEAGQPKEWYLGISGQPVGPMTVAEVKDFSLKTPISGATPVWRPGMPAWASASMHKELCEAIPCLTPMPLPVHTSLRPSGSIVERGPAPRAARFEPTVKDLEKSAARVSSPSRSGPGW